MSLGRVASTVHVGLRFEDSRPGGGLSICAYRGKQDTLAGHRLVLLESMLEVDLKGMKLVFNVSDAFSAMVNGCMMFGEIISIIVDSFVPVDLELLLSLPIPEPIISHVPGLGSFLVDIIINEACCCGVVSFDRSGRLWVVEAV